MPIDSWTKPEDAAALAATATAMIDAALTGSGLSRDAYWAAVRKGYNTPYNDPQPKPVSVQAAVVHGPVVNAPVVHAPVRIDLAEGALLPVAAMAVQGVAAEIHAG